MIHMRTASFAAICLATVTGCSPALNWRNVQLDGAGLTALLPCKPEHAVRAVDVGGRTADLALFACDADDATFAVSHMLAPSAAEADAALAQWRRAVLARWQAEPSGVAPATMPYVPVGALALPSSVRLAAQGRRADGDAIHAEAVWFARLEGSGVRLYHAVVYAPSTRADAANTLFAGLTMR